jgi:hypothetical protein
VRKVAKLCKFLDAFSVILEAVAVQHLWEFFFVGNLVLERDNVFLNN